MYVALHYTIIMYVALRIENQRFIFSYLLYIIIKILILFDFSFNVQRVGLQ